MGRAAVAAGLVAAVGLAFALRALGAGDLVAGDAVVLPIGDAYYHARRALYTAQHWPAVLLFDPLVSFPDGSWIPWPPLHTWLVATLARAAGGDAAAVERVALWLPPALGALAALPVFAAARRLAGAGAGLGAAFLFAALPAQIQYSDAGNVDHHCTIALLGAAWLACALAAAGASPRPPQTAAAAKTSGLPQIGVTLARTGLLLTWPGSLAYVAVADGAQLAVLALAGRAGALAAHAAGLAASAAAVALAVPRLGPPVGGAWSAIALSWLHVAALAALAGAALGCAAWERARPGAAPRVRAARGALAALAAGAALLALPGIREAVGAALGFVGKAEPWAALNAEQLPLFRPGTAGGWLAPLAHYGGFAYAIPLLPLAALARARDAQVRASALVLAGWTAGFGALALAQLRYGNDFAAPFAVATAVGVREAWRALAGRRGGAAGRAALAVLVALLAAPLAAQALGRALARPPLGAGDPRLATPSGTLHRFAELVRAATPETPGFDDPGQRPGYGILAPPNLGHVLHWVARRATASDNFGPYAGSRHFQEARAFSWLESEAEAAALAGRLEARYVVTAEFGAMPPRSLAARLHHGDGRAAGDLPRWERFRLVTEGPAGGQPLAALVGAPAPAGAIPYKLYEVVPGAVLEAAAPPGTPVDARITLETPIGRRFPYRAVAPAGDDGVARLRVPYPSEGDAPVRALGPWRVHVGDVVYEVAVPEAAVREGTSVAVEGG
jgi:dolichyl-diphosphooligosaccharide--protein glycosyltransferase